MNDLSSTRTGQIRYDAGTVADAVADDMVAIFGPGVRVGAGQPQAAFPSKRSGNRRGLTVAAIGGALAIAVAAGTLVGNATLGVPATPRTLPSRGQTFRSVERFGPSRVRDVVSSSISASISMPVTAPTAAPIASGEVSGSVQEQPSPVKAAAIVTMPAPRPALVPAVPQLAATTQESAVPAPTTGRQRGCDDDSEACLSRRIDAVDRHLSDVFDEAAAAGVRSRVLRDYRKEWLRAQDEAIDRPFYALRLYEMITSDLYAFTDDAERGGAGTR